MRRTGLGIAAAFIACGLLGCTAKADPPTEPSPLSHTVTPPVAVAEQVAKTRAMLAQLRIGGRAAKTGYQRTDDFGAAWLDVDGNGCRTRDDVLARDLSGTARRRSCGGAAGGVPHPPTRQAPGLPKGAPARRPRRHP